MNQSLSRICISSFFLAASFSSVGLAEKSYLPESLKTVDQIKNQRGKVDFYRGGEYVPAIPGADIPQIREGYELPKYFKPYEFKTSQGTVQVYKPLKVYDVPQVPNVVPRISDTDLTANASSAFANSKGEIKAEKGDKKKETSVTSSSETSASPPASTAATKKKVGLWVF